MCRWLHHLQAQQQPPPRCHPTPGRVLWTGADANRLGERRRSVLACATGPQGSCELEPRQEKQERVPRRRSPARRRPARPDMCHICSPSRAINRRRDRFLFTLAASLRLAEPGLTRAGPAGARERSLTSASTDGPRPVHELFTRPVQCSWCRSSPLPRQPGLTRPVSQRRPAPRTHPHRIPGTKRHVGITRLYFCFCTRLCLSVSAVPGVKELMS